METEPRTEYERLMQRGLACWSLGEAERALRYFRQADIRLRTADSLYNIAIVLMERSAHADAIPYLRSVVEMALSEGETAIGVEALDLLTTCYCTTRQIPEALETARQALELAPESPELRETVQQLALHVALEPLPRRPTVWVLCAGMMRSGSTVQYQLTRAIVERAGLGRGLWYARPQDFAAMVEQHRGTGEMLVVKCHNLLPGVRELVEAGEGRVLYTYRDLRDVVVSYTRVESRLRGTEVSFWDAVEEGFIEQRLEDDRNWFRLPGILRQRYEDWSGDLQREALRIAEFLGIELEPGAAAELAAEFDIDSQRTRVPEYEYKIMYPEHIASGVHGQWKEQLSREELEYLEEWIGDWLVMRDYELSGGEEPEIRPAFTNGQITEGLRRRAPARRAESPAPAEMPGAA